ncbi:hypothetical protein D3C71_1834490 [compost metagenome]
MLEHTHRCNLVVGRGLVELAVVQQFHTDPAGQALFLDQLRHMRMLVARQRDAGGVHAIVFGGP